MKTKDWYKVLSEYKLLVAAIVLLFLTVVLVQINYNKNNMHNFTVDEYYTIATIHPRITPDQTIYRALNGPRIFTYLFYPGALVGMIKHMGGNIYEDGWDYPGHNYFVKHYNTSTSNMGSNMEDPNLRYFHYYLKLQTIFLVFLSLLPLVYYAWKRKFFVAMFMMSTLIGINFLALEERSLFYIEPFLLIMLNILTWLYLYLSEKKEIGWFWIVFSSFLFALTVSLKFSCLFFLVLIGFLICSKFKSLEKRISAAFGLVGFSLAFFCLINWNIFESKEVFNNIVHDYFSNFYQYATGNKSVAVEHYKLHNLRLMVKALLPSMGGLVFLFPVMLFFGLKSASKATRLTWIPLIITAMVSVGFIAGQIVYLDRNILPFLPILLFILGVMTDLTLGFFFTKKPNGKSVKPLYLYLLTTAIILLPIWASSKNYVRKVWPSPKKNIVKTIRQFENQDRRLVNIGSLGFVSEMEFAEVTNLPSAPITTGANLKDFLNDYVRQFRANDIVVVPEVGNNKQLSNYLLPRIFNSNVQFSEYFVFYNDEKKNKAFKKIVGLYNAENSKTVLMDSLGIRNDLALREVKLSQGKSKARIFFKFDFYGKSKKGWEGCRFYFHALPYENDIEKLPEARIQYGFDGWDFSVIKENTVWYGNNIYLYHDFEPTLKQYKGFKLGIFRGCAKSEEVIIENITLE